MRLVFDIEANGFLKQLTTIHCLAIRNLDKEDEVWSYKPDEIEQGLEHLLQADELIGHNIIAYDIPAIQKVYPQFDTKDIKITDTLVLSRLIAADIGLRDYAKQPDMPKRLYGSHSLKAWGYRLGEYKGDFGENNDWSAWTQEMHDYMVQDTLVNHRLWYALAPESWSQNSIDFEMKVADICNRIGTEGWTFDTAAAGKLYAQLVKEKDELTTELKDLFPPWNVEEDFIPRRNNKTKGYIAGVPFTKVKQVEFNPTSRKQIELCLKRKYDWKPKEYNANGVAKIDETVLASLPYPEAKSLSRVFMLQKRLGQLAEGKNAWLKLVDGKTLRHNINPNGTLTGRASHHQPNLAQVPAVRAEYGKECRELFTVPKGYSLVAADLSGLELRVLASLMNDGGAYAKQILDGDIHTANQEAMGLDTRSQAKTAIYALIYGSGNTRLGEITGKGAEEGRRIRDAFVKANPSFASLVRAAKAAVNNRGHLIGLDGRKVYCDSDFKALNYLIQCNGALICKKWLQLTHEQFTKLGIDARIVAWVHDEIQVKVRKGSEDVVCNLLRRMAREAGNHFKIQIPIEAESTVGTNWATTH